MACAYAPSSSFVACGKLIFIIIILFSMIDLSMLTFNQVIKRFGMTVFNLAVPYYSLFTMTVNMNDYIILHVQYINTMSLYELCPGSTKK